MIRTLHKFASLTTFIHYNNGRMRRDPSIPTQASYLKPFTISNLSDNLGAKRNIKRLGRGPGSTKG